ncbi:hypothetical protein RU639_003204 [Aspergillus parasiticus]
MAALNAESVAHALDALSPSDVQGSQRLLSSFRAFFARGSARDFYELLPNHDGIFSEQSRPNPSSQYPKDSRNIRNADCQQKRKSKASASKEDLPVVVSPDPGSVEGHSLAAEMQEARVFCAVNVSSQAQQHRLMRVLEGVLKAPRQSANFYLGLWSAHRSRVFDTNGAVQSRIARLFQGRKLIEQEFHRFEYAGRLSLIFLTHDIEIIKAQNWKLAPGQSRQHAAVISIADHLNVEPEEIKKEWRRSRNYIRLLEECGPASLLELGTGVNWYWEKALSKQDVTLFIQFYKERKPSFASHTNDLNAVAGEIIIDGMLAYGWTLDAIRTGKTRLCNALAIHCPHLFRSPVTDMASPKILSPDRGGLNQSKQPSLTDPPAFRTTVPPAHPNLEHFLGFELSGDWDLYLSRVPSDQHFLDESCLQTYLDSLEMGVSGNCNMELPVLEHSEREDDLQMEL